jgi:hypothetical protein
MSYIEPRPDHGTKVCKAHGMQDGPDSASTKTESTLYNDLFSSDKDDEYSNNGISFEQGVRVTVGLECETSHGTQTRLRREIHGYLKEIALYREFCVGWRACITPSKRYGLRWSMC